MAHAAALAGKEFPEIDDHTYIIIVEHDDIENLGWNLVLRSQDKIGCKYVQFFEPDLGNQLTAIAMLNPTKFVSTLKLWQGGDTNGN